MSDVRVMALHKEERQWILAQLQRAIIKDEAERQMQNDVSEVLLNAMRPRDLQNLGELIND